MKDRFIPDKRKETFRGENHVTINSRNADKEIAVEVSRRYDKRKRETLKTVTWCSTFQERINEHKNCRGCSFFDSCQVSSVLKE